MSQNSQPLPLTLLCRSLVWWASTHLKPMSRYMITSWRFGTLQQRLTGIWLQSSNRSIWLSCPTRMTMIAALEMQLLTE